MTTNPINEEPVNESRNDDVQQTDDDDDDDDEEQLPFSLTLGSKSYSSKIRPKTSPVRIAPPPEFAGPMTTWPTPADLLAARSMPPYPTPPPHLIPSWMSDYPHHQTPNPPQLVTNFFPPLSSFAPPPSNLSTPPAIRPVTAPVRGYRSQSTANQKSGTISPPFPWATNYRGQIQSLEYLESKQITTITGDVQCRHCENVYQVSYNLKERFAEVEKIFITRKRIMRERAPSIWLNPEQRRCELCGREKAVKPVIAERKSQINWLFLLLGQTLGFCTLEQLKNFCKHSKSHRTGAKDRVLYLTYLGLCKMLQPKCDLFTRDSTGAKR